MIRKLLCIALLSAASSVAASTITVNSLSDATGCSLRNAIIAANTDTATVGCTAGQAPPVIDTITIAVAGTYSPTSALPTVMQYTTMTGTLPNFVLDGTSAGASSAGLTLSGINITVRGLVVQNFSGSGIEIIGGSGIVVAGNRIGTDASATTAAPNCTGVGMTGGGVHLVATGTQISIVTIGGANTADKNVISGNQCSGILAEANGTATLSGAAEGNYIGTNFCGCDALPNTGYGVDVEGTKATFTIGSTDTFANVCNGRCNVIASNALGQVKINSNIVASNTATSVLHNVIGANANMTAGLPTDTAIATGDGILISSQGNAFINGNIIVRSSGAGIRVDGGGIAAASFNRIGATSQGSVIPNAIGIRFHDTTVANEFRTNTVVGNTGAGIWLDGAQNAILRNNFIGVIQSASGIAAGNQGGGILISNSAGQTASNDTIGGGDDPNQIAFNTIDGHGPAISVASGVSNRISENSIYLNIGTLSSLGIDLGADGPDANDPCDSDSGPNNRQNSPVITYATRATTNSACPLCGTRAAGTLVGQANTQYRIELFTNAAGSSTPGQSQGYLGFVDTTTDASCNASWVVQAGLGALGNVVATATSPTGDTSEISAPVTAWPGQRDPRYDHNFDGFTDLLLRNYSNGANAAWLLDGQQNLLSIQNLAALPNTDYHLESNFYIQQQGNNRNLLWRNYTTGANAIWIMNGSTGDPTSIVDLPALPNTQYYVGGTADFDGDGYTDIVWRNNTTGAVAIWLMNGTNYVSTVNLPSVGIAQWTIAGTGDFNDDGRADILWHNTSTAANAIWFLDGTTYVSTQNIQSIPNTAYVPVAIADYNGDHHSDIVWHNTTTGANAIWLMNGTTLSTIANLPTVPNTSIVPAGPK